MYPNEPVITVVAPLIDAQLVETAVIAQINHQSLIATKTSRIVWAAQGRLVSDFGARRAHNMDAAVYGARAAYIGGASRTATVMAGQKFGIPVNGTMAPLSLSIRAPALVGVVGVLIPFGSSAGVTILVGNNRVAFSGGHRGDRERNVRKPFLLAISNLDEFQVSADNLV